MKRSPLNRKTPLRPRTPPDRPGGSLRSSGPLRAKSARRRAEDARGGPREAVREATFARAGHRCQAIGLIPRHVCAFYPPNRPGLECHEVIPRSVWPTGDLDLRNTKALCPLAHTWVDNHPSEAHELGLHGYSWERPDGGF